MTYELAALGCDAAVAGAYRRFDRRDARLGRVLRADRGVCTVVAADGVDRASLAGAVLLRAVREPTALPCAGDWVVLRRWPDRRTTVEAVLPRRTVLMHRAAGAGQVLAVNMDVVAVVEPIHPAPDDARLERLLTAARVSGARPVVVLSKCDVAPDPAAVTRQLASVAPGVPVLPVSARDGSGLPALRRYVAAGRTLALLGRSGVGKSTLVDALAGGNVMTTREARRTDGTGRSTEAYRCLVPLPGGGALIDTPGLDGGVLLDGGDGWARAFVDGVDAAGRPPARRAPAGGRRTGGRGWGL